MSKRPDPRISPAPDGPGGISGRAGNATWFNLGAIALRDVFSLNLQNLLTLFTMAIGSMALASTLFIGEGALQKLWEALDKLMGDQVLVSPEPGPNRILLKKRASADLTVSDYLHVKSRLKEARYVVPRYFGRAYVEVRNTSWFASVDGIAPELEREPMFAPAEGRSFSAQARDGLVLECLITRSAAESFGVDLAGSNIVRIETYRFTVVGIIPNPPEADRNFRNRVVVPYTWAHYLWGVPGRVQNIAASWTSPQQMESLITGLKAALDECRAPDAYHLSSSQFQIKKRKNIVSNFMAIGTAQAFFCILVASIGIINVMLANVVRRTREFAIRVAMGARHIHIVAIVLAESGMLGLAGAVAGILVAMMTSSFLSGYISARIPEASQLQPLIGFKSIAIPVLVCGISGVIAGIMPALRAKKLDILSVLRGE